MSDKLHPPKIGEHRFRRRLPESDTPRTDAAEFAYTPGVVSAAFARQLERRAALLDWIEQSARTNPDKTVVVKFVREGEWLYTHGDPAQGG